MKEAIKIKLFLIGLIVVLLSACSFAQSGFDTNLWKSKKQIRELDKLKIKLDLSVTIDNQEVNDTTFVLEVYNKTKDYKSVIKVSNKFVLYLDYNCDFEISLSYSNTNKKTIYMDTDSPFENWYIITGIDLNKWSNKHIIAGGLRYNGKLQTFEKYKL